MNDCGGSFPSKGSREDGAFTLFPVLVIVAADSRFVVGRVIGP
jgi:hypothetical protein